MLTCSPRPGNEGLEATLTNLLLIGNVLRVGVDDMNALFADKAKLFLVICVQALRRSKTASTSRRVTRPGSTFPPP